MKLVIDGRLPGLNEIIKEAKKGRGGYQPYAIMKREYTDEIAWLAKKMPKYHGQVEINITWYEKNYKRDIDNVAAGGTKLILDGLVLAGVLKDDSQKFVKSINHYFKVDKNNPRIEVKVKKIESE